MISFDLIMEKEEVEQKSASHPKLVEKSICKVFIGGLSPLTTSEDLRKYFSKFGRVEEVTVMREKETGRSRCFAFMTFSSQNALEKVLKSSQHWLQGRTIEVKKAIPKGEVKTRSRKLFIGGIPPSVTSESLRVTFEKYGKLLDAHVMTDHVRGRPRGFGFVTFESDEAVDLVLAESQHELGGKVVDVKKAEPRKNMNFPSPNSPYSVIPTFAYFVPYQILPGQGGESYMTIPSPVYSDFYYYLQSQQKVEALDMEKHTEIRDENSSNGTIEIHNGDNESVFQSVRN